MYLILKSSSQVNIDSSSIYETKTNIKSNMCCDNITNFQKIKKTCINYLNLTT